MKPTDTINFLYIDYICNKCNYTISQGTMVENGTIEDVLQNITSKEKSCYTCKDEYPTEMSIIRATISLNDTNKRKIKTTWHCSKCSTSWASFEHGNWMSNVENLQNTTCCPNVHCLSRDDIYVTSMKKV